jgi:hypothetical protein
MKGRCIVYACDVLLAMLDALVRRGVVYSSIRVKEKA